MKNNPEHGETITAVFIDRKGFKTTRRLPFLPKNVYSIPVPSRLDVNIHSAEEAPTQELFEKVDFYYNRIIKSKFGMMFEYREK